MKASVHRLPDGVTPMNTNLVGRTKSRLAVWLAVAMLAVVIGSTVLMSGGRTSTIESALVTPTREVEQ